MTNFIRTIDCAHSAISNHKDVRELYDLIRGKQHQKANSQSIFVWNGFGTEISPKFFESNTWQQNFVGMFNNQEMWPWKFKLTSSEPDRLGNKELIKALSTSPQNLIASLRIRSFDSDDLVQGSVEWFDKIVPYLNNKYQESIELLALIVKSIRAAKEVGINLLLEKISLIINNDPINSITLTPHLHRDGAYGHLESSTVSFYSERTTPHSSTLFFPDFDFESVSHLKPITAMTINKECPNTLAYSIASGDLAIFSGKMASDGQKCDTHGALHMSPEGFFPTRRLLLLFRSNIS